MDEQLKEDIEKLIVKYAALFVVDSPEELFARGLFKRFHMFYLEQSIKDKTF